MLVEICRLIPSIRSDSNRTLPRDKEMCGEAHVDVTGSILVCVLEHDTEAVREDREIERILFDVRAYFGLIVHRNGEEYDVFTAIPFRYAIQVGYFAMADLAPCGPESEHNDLSL